MAIDPLSLQWDLNPGPTKRIGLKDPRYDVLEYADWAVEADPWAHRHGGQIYVNHEELTYILNGLHAHFELMIPNEKTPSPVLQKSLDRLSHQAWPDPKQTAHLGVNRHYFPLACHEIREISDKKYPHFILLPGQLIEEPLEVTRGDRVLKLRNLNRDTQQIHGFLLCGSQELTPKDQKLGELIQFTRSWCPLR